ncbi:MAG: DUF3343 domain-containing protein [Gammaproteobacteria bacterium]|nr:DUF3343 domain-containing protein [Gammaproteobacteria bacterium]
MPSSSSIPNRAAAYWMDRYCQSKGTTASWIPIPIKTERGCAVSIRVSAWAAEKASAVKYWARSAHKMPTIRAPLECPTANTLRRSML